MTDTTDPAAVAALTDRIRRHLMNSRAVTMHADHPDVLLAEAEIEIRVQAGVRNDFEAAFKKLEWAARKVVENFTESEAQGYRSRDRQYAIDMLGRCLPPLPETSESGGGGDV